MAKFEYFVSWCCPEGTYVERGGRLCSFTKSPRPECSLPPATVTEETGASHVGVWVNMILSVLITLVLCLCCRACRKQQAEFEKEETRRERLKSALYLSLKKRKTFFGKNLKFSKKIFLSENVA